jgi:hypothetical protein
MRSLVADFCPSRDLLLFRPVVRARFAEIGIDPV